MPFPAFTPDVPPSTSQPTDPRPARARWRTGQRHLLALAVSGGVALASLPLHDRLELTNIVMVDLLAVVLVAVWLGRSAAVLCALTTVALFDFAHVPPRWSFAVGDMQYLLTLVVMLTVALTISQLTEGLRRQADAAQDSARRHRALYDLARQMAGAMTVEQLEAALRAHVASQLDAELWLLRPHDREHPALALPDVATSPLDTGILQVAQALHRQWPGHALRQRDGSGAMHLVLPLAGSTRSRGVLVLRPRQATDAWAGTALAPMMDALAALVATSLERLHFVDVAHRTQMEMRDERLRSSILSALSHDVRTPLTALVGSAEALTLLPEAPLTDKARALVDAVRSQALRLHHMVSNLLDMARLQGQRTADGGQVRLRCEWQPIDEVIGASIQLLGTALQAHPVQVRLPEGLPLVHIDAVLMERVFGNLLENAAKYGEPGPIEIDVQRDAREMRVNVRNRGQGFPADRLHEVFDVFERGHTESATPGMGLGLSICRAIVEAHGGRIRADNPPGAARVTFTLPLGTPPALDVLDASAPPQPAA